MTRYIMAQDKKRRALQVVQPDRSFRPMEAESADPIALDEEPSGALASAPHPEVAAASAPVLVESLHSPLEASVGVDNLEVKEEVDFSPEVETCDLQNPPLQPRVLSLAPEASQPRSSQGVESIAPAEATEPSASIEVGTGPSAPSREKRTRGARGGKDTQFKHLRRIYYQG